MESEPMTDGRMGAVLPATRGAERVVAEPVIGGRGRDALRRVLILLVSDALALSCGGIGAYLLWASPVKHQAPALYLPFASAIPIFLIGYAIAGLYPGFGLGPVELLRRYWLVTLTGFVGIAALTFALKLPDVYSRATLGLAFVFSLLLVPTFRRIASRLARGAWGWWSVPAVLVGDGQRTELARRHTETHPSREFRAVGLLTESDVDSIGGPPALGTLEDAPRVAASGVRVAFADIGGPDAEAKLDRLRLVFPRVIILRDFAHLPVDGIQLRNLGGVLGLEYGNNLLQPRARWLKRLVDVVGGGLALLLCLPIIALAVIAVKVSSRGPALYWQVREGRRGREIRVPKVRTMVLDAESRMARLLEQDADLRAQWNDGFKLRDDPRVIPVVGRLLRRFSIDELPQLWSVVKGDMSLVGPRPFPEYHLDALGAHARSLRAEVRPGLTGLWQIRARGKPDIAAQESYDTFYIRNWSVWLDLYILAHTVSAVLYGRGAY